MIAELSPTGSQKPNCYTCKHRGTLIGNCHSRCLHPEVMFFHTPSATLMSSLMGRMGSSPRKKGKLEYLEGPNCNPLNIEGSAHGVSSGWFWWPWNFDPIWLVKCDGYETTTIP